jgi:taurine dioxygenase
MTPPDAAATAAEAQIAVEPLTITPLTGALGAEIDGVDLRRPLEEATKQALRRALRDHLVIYLPHQDITREQHLAFAATFGPIMRIRHILSVDGYDDVQIVRRDATDRDTYVTGGNWHTDSTYLECPPAAVAMRGIVVPDVGGDTMFANTYLAYEALSPGMQRMLGGLKAVHSASWLFGSAAQKRNKGYEHTKAYSYVKDMDVSEGDREVLHPVVCTHPETGRRSLYVNRVYVQRFDGMTEDESRSILQFLYDHLARPEFTCRVRWRKNQMLVWDNRYSMHRAIGDYPGKDRYLERVTVAGPRPS